MKKLLLALVVVAFAAPAFGATIYEIQDGTIPTGTDVTVENVIVMNTPITFTSSEAYCFVEESGGGMYSGVEVYWGTAKAALYNYLQPGDVVTIIGVTGEYYDMTEIDISGVGDTLWVTGTAPLPGPDPVGVGPAFDEPWEGVLVRLECTEVFELYNYGEWGIQDAFGGIGRCDDKGPITYVPFVGDWKHLIGIMTFSYGNYVLWPRGDGDIIETEPTATDATTWGNIKALYQ